MISRVLRSSPAAHPAAAVSARAPRGAAGFSLIEVMMAMVMLAIGMLAMGVAQLQALTTGADAKNRSQAMYLAEEQLALFMAMGSGDPRLLGSGGSDRDPIVLARTVAPSTTANPAGVGETTEYYRSWTLTPLPKSASLSTALPGLSNNMLQITVTVRWVGGKGSSQVQLIGVR